MTNDRQSITPHKTSVPIRHCQERIRERLNLPEATADSIQKKIDNMWYSYGRHKLTGDKFHFQLLGRNGVRVGYATLEKVGRKACRQRLVLTTFLTPRMTPQGEDIGSFLNTRLKGLQIPEAFTTSGETTPNP